MLAFLVQLAAAQDKADERELKGAREAERMKQCHKQALERKLMGRARETFMSQCLKR
jgi:psiF repeat